MLTRVSDNRLMKRGDSVKIENVKYTIMDWSFARRKVRVKGPSGKSYLWAAEDLGCTFND